MATDVAPIDFTFDPDTPKCVIEASGTVTTSGDVTIENSLSIEIKNQDNDWISLVIETVDGQYFDLTQTARLNPGDTVTEVRQLPAQVAGRNLHIYRWAPGFLNLPGSGGGEARFTMPREGAVSLHVTCIHAS
jgi:hypothetical protein